MGIRTTHVGSLVRPAGLRSFLDDRLAGRDVDEAAFAACLRDSVADVVRRQAEVGIDIVSDGEFGKWLSWSSYVNLRLAGIEHRPDLAEVGEVVPTSTDVRLFPEFWGEYMATQNFDTEA